MQTEKSLTTQTQQQSFLELIYKTRTITNFLVKPKEELVRAVFYCKKVKDLSEDEFIAKFTKEFIVITELYCGVDGSRLSQFSVLECAKQFKEHFPNLSVEEIREAYSLASRKEIEVDINAYFGKFTVSTFNTVLTEYVKYRQRILSALREIEKEDEELIAKRKSDELKAKFEIDIIQWFESQKQNFTLKNLNDITYGQAKHLIENGVVPHDEIVRNKAIVLAEADAKNKMLKASDKSSYKKANDFISEIASQKDSHHHVNSIYFKLLVYEFLRKCNVNNS
jgi:hypothetical protein